MTSKINVQMTVKAMHQYLLYHTYMCPSGVFGVLLGFICYYLGYSSMVLESTSKMLVFYFLGTMLIFINPIMLWTKAAKQVKTVPMFKEPITYVLDEKGITISQNGQGYSVPWDEVAKIVETKDAVIIYISRIRAFILTKESLEEQKEEVYGVLRTNINDRRNKLKA